MSDFAHVDFGPIELIDADGNPHVSHFRAHLLGEFVALDAIELNGQA